MTHTPFVSNPCPATAIVFVSQNLFYGQLPARRALFSSILPDPQQIPAMAVQMRRQLLVGQPELLRPHGVTGNLIGGEGHCHPLLIEGDRVAAPVCGNVLINDPDITWDEIIQSITSSQYQDHIDFMVIYAQPLS